MKKTLVSIVIPVFNEAENVGLLHGEIAAAVKEERRILCDLKARANKVIDTSKLALGELKEIIRQ